MTPAYEQLMTRMDAALSRRGKAPCVGGVAVSRSRHHVLVGDDVLTPEQACRRAASLASLGRVARLRGDDAVTPREWGDRLRLSVEDCFVLAWLIWDTAMWEELEQLQAAHVAETDAVLMTLTVNPDDGALHSEGAADLRVRFAE